MNAPRSYRRGIALVAGTVLASAALCLATVGPRPESIGPAGERLDAHPMELGTFRLVERSGREVTESDLADDVWIAGFIFTHCRMSCPKITGQMQELARELADTGVRLVSVTVDPERDTPEALSRYANLAKADADRWWFLTGPKPDVYDFLDRFKLLARETTPEEQLQGAEEIAHARKFALVDRGNRVVGYFDAEDAQARARLLKKAARRDDTRAALLPRINATLNGSCAILLILGLTFIRSGLTRLHIATMIAALAVSALFLGCYLFYHFLVVRGSVPFEGVGKGVRVAYFTILLSHTVLAVAMLPFLATTLFHSARKRWDRHARVASFTFPIWLYVSITGVVVYLMLYQLDFSGIATASPPRL